MLRATESTVAKKALMAVSGIALFGFVVGHLLGNLKIYGGESPYNEYARFLRRAGEPALPHGALLWAVRVVLLGCAALHVVEAVQLRLRNRRARTSRYVRRNDLSLSRASRTLYWGGLAILAFVVYHLLHLTVGTIHPDFAEANVYRNVVLGFRVPWVSAAYVLAMIPLGLHLYHGLWSATHTLSLAGPRLERWRRPAAGAVAALIVLGNVSIPVAVLLGWVG